MNAFGWTYRIRYVNEEGVTCKTVGNESHYPMITWPVQDEAIDIINDGILNGYDINFKKTRDIGASWLVLFAYVQRFLFNSEEHFGVISRKEDLVDSAGDMDSLFEKCRYIIRMCPSWMKPRMKSRYMSIQNLETNCTIIGESTNANVGTGGRKTSYMVDEAAKVNNGEAVESSLSQNTACQIWVSSSFGIGNQFYRRVAEKRGRLILAPWWRHPQKAQGAKQIRLADGRIKWTSPWYELESRRISAKALAQEVDMDDGKAGDSFFEQDEIERHRRDHERAPDLAGELVSSNKEVEPGAQAIDMIRSNNRDAIMFIRASGRRRWKLWFPLEDGHPPQNWQYIFGIDIATGSNSSNSVCSVFDVVNRRFVAKFWDSRIKPEDFAATMVEAAVWFGGLGTFPFLVWENNGVGGAFGRKVVKLGYPSFYCQKQEAARDFGETKGYGWNSNRNTKNALLGLYRESLSTSKAIQPCKESLDEALDYIYDEGGTLVPGQLREETDGGRSLHGDHVIADALCILGAEEAPTHRGVVRAAPTGSFQHRRQMAENRKGRESDTWR